jgi:peptide/nickel transport system permease protein
MAKYIAGRLAATIVVLSLICLVTFAIFFWLSPDPANSICGRTCTPDRIATIRALLGINQPFLAQFWHFAAGIFAGRSYGTGASAVQCSAPCLGYSFQQTEGVWQLIASRLTVTITLAVGAAVLWLLVSIVAGLVSALREGSWVDHGTTVVTLGVSAVPNFVLALALQYLLVVVLHWLPFPETTGFLPSPWAWFESYLMPWTTLAAVYAAFYTRLTRASVIETLQENYVRTARAKGLRPDLLLRRHALRPALTPLMTIFGMDLAALMGGAVITETVFGLNGVGQLVFNAITGNDQPVIMGVTLLAAFALLMGNLIVDISYAYLDPRVRIAAS